MGDGLISIFARNCEVRRIDKDTARIFLDTNHRMGDTKARYRYGLFVKRSTGAAEATLSPGSMVAVASFSNARTMRDGTRSYEWIRYSSLDGYRVVGGMGKLLDAFVDELHPGDVMTYVDAASSDGASYRELGFELETTISRPTYTNHKFRKRFPL